MSPPSPTLAAACRCLSPGSELQGPSPIQALEAVNRRLRELYPDSEDIFDIVLVTNNHAQVGVRLINSINHYGEHAGWGVGHAYQTPGGGVTPLQGKGVPARTQTQGCAGELALKQQQQQEKHPIVALPFSGCKHSHHG